jgi:hypothetical protein
MAAWRPKNKSNRKGIRTPSFIEIALAVMKRALLTDDDNDDGRHVIAIAHQRELKRFFCNSFCVFGWASGWTMGGKCVFFFFAFCIISAGEEHILSL